MQFRRHAPALLNQCGDRGDRLGLGHFQPDFQRDDRLGRDWSTGTDEIHHRL